MKTGAVLTLVAGILLAAATTATSAPETFSIDMLSPSPNDPADLLNPSMTVQVFKANLGLGAGDELDGLSTGIDAVRNTNIIYFSVDRDSWGVANGPLTPLDVRGQANLNQEAGDIFVTTSALGVGSVPQGINSLHINQNFYGEIPVTGALVDNADKDLDNLDAFSFEEFELTGDKVQDRPVYFSLDLGSPSLGALSAADILISPSGGGGFAVFATANQMGLDALDDLDALALLDLDGSMTPTPGDLALFSLAPGSPTLAALGASPADLFLTTFDGTSFVRYGAASLGLLETDNVDALEVQLPEPATMILLTAGGVLLMLRRRRRR